MKKSLFILAENVNWIVHKKPNIKKRFLSLFTVSAIFLRVLREEEILVNSIAVTLLLAPMLGENLMVLRSSLEPGGRGGWLSWEKKIVCRISLTIGTQHSIVFVTMVILSYLTSVVNLN